jgi:integrase/recombinase XerD
MSNAGIPLRIIQEISGHSNLEQLQHYLEVKPDQVKGAIASLSMLSYRKKCLLSPLYLVGCYPLN